MSQAPYFLYAEDDPDDVNFFKEFLAIDGGEKELVSVSDGFAVIDFLQNVKRGDAYPALIVLDIRIPRLSGIETLKLLKTDDIYRLIPVVMFTSTCNKLDDATCTRLGVDIVTKPLNYEHWNTIMAKVCSYAE